MNSPETSYAYFAVMPTMRRELAVVRAGEWRCSAYSQSVEECQYVVGRLVAAGRDVLGCGPGDRPFLEGKVGMDVDLRG